MKSFLFIRALSFHKTDKQLFRNENWNFPSLYRIIRNTHTHMYNVQCTMYNCIHILNPPIKIFFGNLNMKWHTDHLATTAWQQNEDRHKPAYHRNKQHTELFWFQIIITHKSNAGSSILVKPFQSSLSSNERTKLKRKRNYFGWLIEMTLYTWLQTVKLHTNTFFFWFIYMQEWPNQFQFRFFSYIHHGHKTRTIRINIFPQPFDKCAQIIKCVVPFFVLIRNILFLCFSVCHTSINLILFSGRFFDKTYQWPNLSHSKLSK